MIEDPVTMDYNEAHKYTLIQNPPSHSEIQTLKTNKHLRLLLNNEIQ